MSGNKKVVKFKRRKDVNIGIVIFLIMFVYIAINVTIYFTKDHMTIYEVQAGSNTDDTIITGLILRDEELVYSNEAGYISYYLQEGARAAKDSAVYSIDDNKQVYDIIMDEDTPFTLTKENSTYISNNMKQFQQSFSDDNFSEVYDFKTDVNNTVLELLSISMINNSQKIQEETGVSSSYQMMKATKSGIVTYNSDSYEAITTSNLTKELFNPENYQRTSLITKDIVAANSPIYKLIHSDEWSIVLPLSEEQYQKLLGKDSIKFTFTEDDFTASAGISLFQNGTDFYAKLSLHKYMAKYLEDRFIEIELSMSTAEGLKVPITAIVEKDFYLIPLEYFTTGGDSTKKGLSKKTYNKSGEVTITFIPTDIYFQDETYGYVDAKQFASDTLIGLAGSTSDTFQIGPTGKLKGVFNVNKGYAVFNRIEVLYENDEYSIVNIDTEYGLSIYDHIALDGTTAVEQEIIY